MSKNISEYWQRQGKTLEDLKEGKTFESSVGLMCNECCNKDRETDCHHYYRPNCPYCLGTGRNKSCPVPTVKDTTINHIK